jgi:hypothetical protein
MAALKNMAYHSPHPSKQDKRAVIQFLGTEGSQAADVPRWQQAVYSSACVCEKRRPKTGA